MYRIDKTGCPSGYAYVVDYMGNRVYYGTEAECISALEDLNTAFGGEYTDD